MVGCSRCLVNDHHVRTCNVPWPFHTEQVCDYCEKASHEAKDCPKKGDHLAYCKTCGHGWHTPQRCKIANSSLQENLEQYTRSKYEQHMQTIAIANQINASNASTTPNAVPAPNNSSSYSLPHHPAPNNNPAPTTTSQGPTAMPPRRPITIRRVNNVSRPQPSEREIAEHQYSSLNLQLAPFQEATVPRDKTVSANFFKISFHENDKSRQIRRYRIELGQINDRDVKKREVRRALIEDIFANKRPSATVWATDYFSHIVTVGQRLYNECIDDTEAPVSVSHQRPGQNNNWEGITSHIWFEGMLNVAQLRNYVNPTVPQNNQYHPDEDLKALNLLSWRHIYANTQEYAVVGKNFYVRATSHAGNLTIGEDNPVVVCTVRHGFFSSVRPGNGSLLLNVNNATTAFYPAVNLHEYIGIRTGGPRPDGKLQNELKNLRVISAGDNPQKLRVIRGFGSENVDEEKFEFEGQEVTVRQHMLNKYSQSCSPRAWCVEVGTLSSGGKIYFPADKLTIVDWQTFKSKLTGELTSKMLGFAARPPSSSRGAILGSRRALGITTMGNRNQEQMVSDWPAFGFNIEYNFLSVEARHFRAPLIKFARIQNLERNDLELNIFEKSKYKIAKLDRNWQSCMKQPPKGPLRDSASWDLRLITGDNSSKFYRNAQNVQNEFPILCINRPANYANLSPKDKEKKEKEATARQTAFRKLGTTLAHALTDYGFPQSTSRPYKIVYNGHGNPQTRRQQFCVALNSQAWLRTHHRLVVVVLPDSDVSLYADVKWYFDCLRGIPTLCVTKKAFGCDKGFLGNLILKYNFRQGGTNHVLVNGLGLKESTMVVGADVTHPGKTEDELCPSMAGVVAIVDDEAIHYLASARLQAHNTENILELKEMLIERLQAYRGRSEHFPKRILFYRDGVSESQYGKVRALELTQITAAFNELCLGKEGGPGAMPLITFVIVAKRHHSRFFAEDGHNTVSGLVVDRLVVAPKQFNFYLQAHDCGLPRATARNAHYVVLEDEAGYTADQLQKITNDICFMVSRSTKGLSVCTPARYADKLCDRLRCYMKPALDMNLNPNKEELSKYEQLSYVWGHNLSTARGGRKNPWPASLDNIMFYL